MEPIITAVTSVTSVVASVFGLITGNAFGVFLLASSVVGIGLSIFSKVKKSAR